MVEISPKNKKFSKHKRAEELSGDASVVLLGSTMWKNNSLLRRKAGEIWGLEIFVHFLMAKNAENENIRKNSISSKILDFTINRCKIICSDSLGDVLSIMACLAIFFEYFVLS